MMQIVHCSDEEYRITDPTSVDAAGMLDFVMTRVANPGVDWNMTVDHPMMVKASEYAALHHEHPGMVQEGYLRDDDNSGVVKALPMPDSDAAPTDASIASSVTTGNSDFALMSKEELSAMAVEIGEDIGTGAIARAGAVARGGDGQWIGMVEDGHNRRNKLLHGEMIWHLGQAALENKSRIEGWLNQTEEREKYETLLDWCKTGGADINFFEPLWLPEQGGYRLVATETLGDEEAFMTLPLRLMMSKITARNVRIRMTNQYAGMQLKSTFERSEVWGLTIFLLSEWFKEMKGDGSKWGPLLRTLSVRQITTDVSMQLTNTQVIPITKEWRRLAKDLETFSRDSGGACSGSTNICHSKPNEKIHKGKFDIYMIRWAYDIVEQNAVRVFQKSTGTSFLALVPFINMMDKRVDNKGGAALELDGTLKVRTGVRVEEQQVLSIHTSNHTDEEFFARYLQLPVRGATHTDEALSMLDGHKRRRAAMENMGLGQDMGDETLGYKPNPVAIENPHNYVKLVLPGVVPYDHLLYKCVKRPEDIIQNECDGHKINSEGLRWKNAELKKWRKELNLPGRLQELRGYAMQLHLYGDSMEEAERLRNANVLIQRLPVSAEEIPAEDQLMMLGMASTLEEAVEMIEQSTPKTSLEVELAKERGSSGSSSVRPQLYDAPDPEEDSFAKSAMEDLAMLAAQTQRSVLLGNAMYNATQRVVNETRLFFQDGILPKPGLDSLDELLMKKIGMLFHCGSDRDMRIQHRNISDSLWCAMRVHLMNETELNIFCPANYTMFDESCRNVEFSNFTAISPENERNVISAFRSSINNLVVQFPTTVTEDEDLLKKQGFKPQRGGGVQPDTFGPIMSAAIQLRLREKYLLQDALKGLDVYEAELDSKDVHFQLDDRRRERLEQDARAESRRVLIEEVMRRANISEPLAIVPVDLTDKDGTPTKKNITLYEGEDLKQTVRAFCVKYGVTADGMAALEQAMRSRVQALPPTPPAVLMVGVIGITGTRHILGIPEGSNYTIETSVFCDRHSLEGVGVGRIPGLLEMDATGHSGSKTQCERLLDLVHRRLGSSDRKYHRPPLIVLPVDSPDGRQLKFVVFEGEQHNLLQTTSDFLLFHNMTNVPPLPLAEEMNKRLPNPVLQIPVNLDSQRSVMMRICENDNITNVVEAFVDLYDVHGASDQLRRRAIYGMNPGSFLV